MPYKQVSSGENRAGEAYSSVLRQNLSQDSDQTSHQVPHLDFSTLAFHLDVVVEGSVKLVHLLWGKGFPGLPKQRYAEGQPLDNLLALLQPSPAACVRPGLDGVPDVSDALQAILLCSMLVDILRTFSKHKRE